MELEPPLCLAGNLAGSLKQLTLIFDTCGDPPSSRYLFLGNYVHLGTLEMRTCCELVSSDWDMSDKWPQTTAVWNGHIFADSLGECFVQGSMQCIIPGPSSWCLQLTILQVLVSTQPGPKRRTPWHLQTTIDSAPHASRSIGMVRRSGPWSCVPESHGLDGAIHLHDSFTECIAITSIVLIGLQPPERMVGVDDRGV